MASASDTSSSAPWPPDAMMTARRWSASHGDALESLHADELDGLVQARGQQGRGLRARQAGAVHDDVIVIAALGQTAVQPRIQQQGRERERHVRALHQHQQRQRQHDGRRLDEQQHRTSHARHHDAKRQQARQQMRQRQAFALHHHERVRQQEHHQRYRAERNGRQADEHQPRQLELDGQPVQREQAQQQEVQRVAKLPRLLAVVFDEQKPEHQRGKVYESKLEDHARAFTKADTG